MANQSALGASAEEGARYRAAAITLHWLIAVAIIAQVGLGWYMGTLGRTQAHRDAETLHISIGLTILLFTVARVAVRLANRPPPLPATMKPWERTLSRLTHGAFYILILAIPLTGWAMESTGPRPIPFWGLEWPHAPFVSGLPRDQARPVHETLEAIHGTYLVWTAVALLALHVLGALRHQFSGSPVLWRMLPFLPRPPG